jgi:membrane protease YdiL (CAAX protease family)
MPPRSTLSIPEALIVSGICFGLSILWSIQAVLAGFPDAPFSDGGMVWMLGLELVLAASALIYLKARGFDIAALVPHPTLKDSALGLGVCVVACFLGAVVTSAFVDAQNTEPIERMVSESTLSMPVIIAFALVNATFEEVFLLGVLVRGLRSHGLSIAIGLPLLVRVMYHLYQGPVGAVWVLVFGLCFTLFYVRRPVLWPLVFAHVLCDIVPFTTLAG